MYVHIIHEAIFLWALTLQVKSSETPVELTGKDSKKCLYDN